MKTTLSQGQIVTEGPFYLYGFFQDQVWFCEVCESNDPNFFMYLVSDCLSLGLTREFLESASVVLEFFFHYTATEKHYEGTRSITCGLQDQNRPSNTKLEQKIGRIQGPQKEIEEKYLPPCVSIPYNRFFDEYKEEIKRYFRPL